MGLLLILIIISVLVLANIGLGWQVFISGVFKGAEKIISSTPVLENVSGKAKQYIVNITKNASEELIDNSVLSNFILLNNKFLLKI
ncbi:MAG TPA: hypothetical protein VE573_08780 [Nitrososphaeraceae archaeon]|jgi:uncharacterized membrane protein|nr:hypothetical protein [Nitrososphaeraceae archaeon]